jgi:hypothetical protein
MTTPKDVDFMSEEEFEELEKMIQIQPIRVNGKTVPAYNIYRKGNLIGFIGIKAFENKFEQK